MPDIDLKICIDAAGAVHACDELRKALDGVAEAAQRVRAALSFWAGGFVVGNAGPEVFSPASDANAIAETVAKVVADQVQRGGAFAKKLHP